MVDFTSSGFHSLIQQLEQLYDVERRMDDVRMKLSQLQMIEAYGNVAMDHGLSASVVEAMRSTPGFLEAAKTFPEASFYNVVPEHKQSSRQAVGLESLCEAQTSVSSAMGETINRMVDAISASLDNLENTVSYFRSQIEWNQGFLTENETFPDDQIMNFPVYTLCEEGFATLFDILETHLPEIEAFNVEDLKQNPDNIKDEVDGLTRLVNDIGGPLGIDINSFGLTECEKSEIFVPCEGTMDAHNLNRANLVFFLGKAAAVCDLLASLADKKTDLIESLSKAAGDIPVAPNSSSATYGANEHVILICCYGTLVSKMIREAIVVISRLITTCDRVRECIAECHRKEDGTSDAPEPVAG